MPEQGAEIKSKYIIMFETSDKSSNDGWIHRNYIKQDSSTASTQLSILRGINQRDEQQQNIINLNQNDIIIGEE